jgi:hypothetical protein
MNFAHVANDGSEMSFVIKQQVARTTDWQKSKKLSSIENLFSPISLKRRKPFFLIQIQIQDFCNKKISRPSHMTSVPAYAAWR